MRLLLDIAIALPLLGLLGWSMYGATERWKVKWAKRELRVLFVLRNGELTARQIRDQYNRYNHKAISLHQVVFALERLGDKELVQGRFGEPNPDRGNLRRKYWSLTKKGFVEVKARDGLYGPIRSE